MAGIGLQRKQLNARLGRRARPEETSVEDQVKLQGISAGVEIGGKLALQIYENQGQASMLDAEGKVKLAGIQYRQGMLKKLQDAEGFDEISKTINEFKTGIEGNWSQSVGAAEKHVLAGYKGAFRSQMRRKGQLNGLSMQSFADGAGNTEIKGVLQEKFNLALQADQLDYAMALVVGCRAFFGASSTAMIKQINDRQKQMNAEAFENELMGILQEDGPKNLAHFMAQPGIGKQYGFDEKETAAITSTFEGKIASQAATVKSDLLAQQSADRNRMYEVLVSQDLATINEQITKSSLDVDEKILWHSKSKEWSKAIVGETDKFNQTENAVFKEMYGKIARNPNSVGDDELFAKWGDGLSTSDYQKLAKLKEDGQESPLARRTVVNGHSVLDRTASALKSGLAGVGAGKEEIEEVRNIETELLRDKAELDRWAQANPDATDDQVIQKITELNSPRVQAQALGWLERMRRFFRNAAFATAGFRPPGDRETPEVIELEPTIKVITPDGRTGQVPMRNRDKIPPNWTIVE